MTDAAAVLANHSNAATTWLTLTPVGALRAYARRQPDTEALALQALLQGPNTLRLEAWLSGTEGATALYPEALAQGWLEQLPRPLQRPDARLDDFVQHVIASLSGERSAVLASESGFCLGRTGMSQDDADTLSAGAADFSDFAQRQVKRGWAGAQNYVSFHRDAAMLLPEVSLVPFWVDAVGYWLIVRGEPLLNNPALVELIWGIQHAAGRFSPSAA